MLFINDYCEGKVWGIRCRDIFRSKQLIVRIYYSVSTHLEIGKNRENVGNIF